MFEQKPGNKYICFLVTQTCDYYLFRKETFFVCSYHSFNATQVISIIIVFRRMYVDSNKQNVDNITGSCMEKKFSGGSEKGLLLIRKGNERLANNSARPWSLILWGQHILDRFLIHF